MLPPFPFQPRTSSGLGCLISSVRRLRYIRSRKMLSLFSGTPGPPILHQNGVLLSDTSNRPPSPQCVRLPRASPSPPARAGRQTSLLLPILFFTGAPQGLRLFCHTLFFLRQAPAPVGYRPSPPLTRWLPRVGFPTACASWACQTWIVRQIVVVSSCQGIQAHLLLLPSQGPHAASVSTPRFRGRGGWRGWWPGPAIRAPSSQPGR